MEKKIILITGGSSGIGYETAKQLAAQGHTVYAAARRTDKMEPLKAGGVTVLKMDVTSEESLQEGVDCILREQGRIDVLINNAGYGYMGAIENVSMEEAKRQLEVNLFGLARLTQLVLPTMRAQAKGRIINIASIAGRACLAYGGWYNVSKYSVEALSDSLRIEVKQFGIDVVLIEPGGIKTDWGIIAADNLTKCSEGTAYQKSAWKEADLMRKGYTGNLMAKPAAVTKAICRAVDSKRPRIRYRMGTGAGLIIFLHSILPSRWWDAINRALMM